MKKITFLSILLITFLGYAQQQVYNLGFEPGDADGEITNWTVFENSIIPAQIVTNPDPGEVNPSTTTKVLQLDIIQAGDCYGGAVNFHGTLGTWELDGAVTSNLTLSMDVNRSSTAGNIGIKFANATNGTVFEITDSQGAVSAANTWETLTWDISAGAASGDNINIDQMVVFIDFTCGNPDRVEDIQLLVDNITWGANKLTDPPGPTCSDGIQNGDEDGIDCGGTFCAPCGSMEPTVAAPTPPVRNPGDVVSIYSDAYNDVTLDELPTGWSQLGLFEVVQIAGDDTWKLTACEFLGIVTNYGAGVNLGDMEMMHIDYWTPDSNEIGVKIVNTIDGGEDVESLGTTVTGSWQSVEVDMTLFDGNLANLNKITQILIDPSAPSLVFIDNFYFYREALSLDDNELAEFKVFPNPTQNEWNVKSDENIIDIQVFDILGKQVLSNTPNTNETLISGAALPKGMYFAKISTDSGTSTIKLIKR